jgi:hypothetical protein
MILSKLVVKWLEYIIEIGLWASLVGAFVAGIKVGDGLIGSLFSGIVFTIGAGIFCALVFGFFIVLNDIRNMLQQALESRGTD